LTEKCDKKMNIHPTLLIILSFLAITCSTTSQAGQQSSESHAGIIGAVQNFLKSQPEINQHSKFTIHVGHLDNRLRLSACEQPLETYLSPGGKLIGKTSVGVRCSAPKPWALYVPATINIISSVYKAARHLNKGHIIREQDIVSTEYNLSRLNYGFFSNKDELLGKQVKRRLKQGNVITPNQITEPLMVKRGEKVSLISKSDHFAIKMSGEAMMSGVSGDRIRVKNMSSRRIIEGTITQNGEVTVYN
jgi:flagellar basal body P-ring formation protein FlgA